MATGLIGLLEAEFRQLSQDARKGEGITSWLSSSDYPEVKEAAERAVLKVRSFADSPDALEQIRHSKVRNQCCRGAGEHLYMVGRFSSLQCLHCTRVQRNNALPRTR